MSSSVVLPWRTPSIDCEIAPRTPRSVGSAARVAKERLGLDELGRVAPHFVDGEEKDAVASEELAAVGPADGADDVLAIRQRFRQRRRRLLRAFRGCRVEDGDDAVGSLGEQRIQL